MVFVFISLGKKCEPTMMQYAGKARELTVDPMKEFKWIFNLLNVSSFL